MARTASPASGVWWALIGFPILLAALPAAVAAEGPASASTVTERGLHTTTFQTDRGDVQVHLPDDLAAGDTLSGTVVARPSGRSETATRRNADRLEGYVVELGEQRAEVGAGAFWWRVPAAAAASVALVLRDARGREVARGTVPVAPAAGPSPATGLTAPPVGQTGRPVAIDGAFDGRFESTRVTVGGHEAHLLAESPRKLVVESPTAVVGGTTLVVTEGDATSEQPFRNLEIRLSAPHTDLRRSERTTLRVEVSGLEGLETPVPIRVRNETPAVVRIEGGDTQTITIEPAEVGEAGRFVATRGVVGKGVGGFGISARIAVPEDLGGPVAQAQPEPRPEPEPAPEPEPDAAPSGGEPGGSGTAETPPEQDEAEAQPATFQDVNDRLDEAIDGITSGTLADEDRGGVIEEIETLEAQAVNSAVRDPGKMPYAVATAAGMIFGILKTLRSQEADDLTDEQVVEALRSVRDMNETLADDLEDWAERLDEEEAEDEAERPSRGTGDAGPAPEVSEHQPTARVSPNGLLIVEAVGFAPDQEVVVADPSSGKVIARGRTTASGRLVIRKGDSRVRGGTNLEIRCGGERIEVKVEG